MENKLIQSDILCCKENEETFPITLRKIPKSPSVLYYKGKIEIINNNKNIAVIGSRKCSEAGRKLAYRTGQLVGKAGINLVNGLALGCDTEALKGALSVGGKCVAVMPCGLDEIYPKTNQKLAERILENGGCLISEYPVGIKLKNYQYIERDRLQSGVSQGVLVVEAEVGSGTMHTVDFAIKQYRRLACYYHEFLNFSSGNQYLSESGKAKTVKDDKDIQEFLQQILQDEEYEQLSLKLF